MQMGTQALKKRWFYLYFARFGTTRVPPGGAKRGMVSKTPGGGRNVKRKIVFVHLDWFKMSPPPFMKPSKTFMLSQRLWTDGWIDGWMD